MRQNFAEVSNRTFQRLDSDFLTHDTSDMNTLQITDDLDLLLAVLPERIRRTLEQSERKENLIEVIMDLGRLPEARFTDGEMVLSNQEVTREDLNRVVERVGDFGADNRAGIERTLHRISAIRNRKGDVIGLTCRVGRAVYGAIEIIKDIVNSDRSILLLGRPGVGKTTLLREAARLRSEVKRVVIVDTSNEIAGDGDIPHPAIGRSRRMQVPDPSLQHELMIEAVENHMPEVIIIDEIGREQEAIAARTIAERGVQLIGTAHGNSLENLLMNPTLSDLVGGIESVTLSDEEARRRGTQKSVLERRAPPTFDVLIEIKDRQHLVIHHDVAQAVDAILRGRELIPEERFVDEQGVIHVRRLETTPEHSDFSGRLRRKREREVVGEPFARETNGHPYTEESDAAGAPHKDRDAVSELSKRSAIRIYPYGVGQNRLRAAATALNVPLQIVDNLNIADAVMTLKNYYRQQPAPIQEAERRGIPVYILRSNTTAQMEQILVDIFNIAVDPIDAFEEAMRETQEGIQRVLNGASDVTLSPQSAAIRSQQHQLVRAANLISHSYGREPYRRVRIFRR